MMREIAPVSGENEKSRTYAQSMQGSTPSVGPKHCVMDSCLEQRACTHTRIHRHMRSLACMHASMRVTVCTNALKALI